MLDKDKLKEAISKSDLQRVKSILNNDISLIKESLDKEGWTPIHLACFKGNLDVASFIIQCKADINSKTQKNNLTPLHLSCLRGNHEIASLLIQHKAEVNQCADLAWTPLHLAATNGHLKCIQVLLQNQADVNANRPPLGTALHLAAHAKCENCIPVLLEYKANPYALNGLLQTPLEVSQSSKITKRLETTMKRNPPAYYKSKEQTENVKIQEKLNKLNTSNEEEEPKRRPAPQRRVAPQRQRKNTEPQPVFSNKTTNESSLRTRTMTQPSKPKIKLPKPKGKFNFAPPSYPAPPPPDEDIVDKKEEVKEIIKQEEIIKQDEEPKNIVNKGISIKDIEETSSMKKLFARKSVYMDPQVYLSSLEEKNNEEEEDEEEEIENQNELSADELFVRDCSEQCQWFKVALHRKKEKVIMQLYQALYPKYCELKKRNRENSIDGADNIISQMKASLRECEDNYSDILPCVDVEDVESSESSGEWECD